MEIYLYIVAATLILGWILPQKGEKRIYYIFLTAVIHTFVCAFRYEHLTGDLMKYHSEFITVSEYGWFSEELLNEGRNTGFYMLMKLVSHLTNGDFQWLLIIIAVVTQTVVAYMIYRYSPVPWMSFLIWDCMGFYIFGFSAIKQALAMAFVMLAFIGISEKRLGLYLGMMTVAGLIHLPSLIFLPAYWLCQKRVTPGMMVFYLALGGLIYAFKNQFVDFISSFYYEEDEVMVFSGEVGNRFVMILGFTLFSLLFRGYKERYFEALFPIMAIATILQMLSGFDNIFTRLTDYYVQLSVLYLPLLFYQGDGPQQSVIVNPVFPFNRRSMKIMAGMICVFAIWFYYTFSINTKIENEVDNYLNFRFMWDVQR